MRIVCPHCHVPGKITHAVQEAEGLRTLYLDCLNERCGARTVHRLSFSHDAKPPKADVERLVMELLEGMQPEQREKTLDRWRKPKQPLLF